MKLTSLLLIAFTLASMIQADGVPLRMTIILQALVHRMQSATNSSINSLNSSLTETPNITISCPFVYR